MMQLHRFEEGFARMQGPSEAEVKAWAGLVRAQRAATSGIESDLKQAGFPPLAWYDVLYGLRRARRGRLTPRELEGEILLEQYNLSRLLDRMEADGLVRRIPYPGDRRRQLVEITSHGREMQKRMWPVYATAIERHVGARITEQESEALAETLGKLLPSTGA
jgi:DNA-binding MarR family transcriptional regulator